MTSSSMIAFTLVLISAVFISRTHGQTYVCYKMDLIFVVDGSGSICDNDPDFHYLSDNTCDNWKFIVQFIHDIVNGLTISLTETRVAMITFETRANLLWNLTRYTNKADLLAAIDAIPYNKGGQTNTTGALRLLDAQVLGSQGDRPDVNNTAIIITDGKPTDPSTVQAAIDQVHNDGTRTLVVGVTNLVDENTLKMLSSPPQLVNQTYFVAPDYSTIDVVRVQLEERTCEVTTTPGSPTTVITTATTVSIAVQPVSPSTPGGSPLSGCDKIDLCFLIDRSGSICDTDPNFSYQRDNTCANWASVISFVRSLVNDLTIGPNNARVAVAIFAAGSELAWGLSNYTDKTQLLAAIDAIKYIKGGTTDTTGGLNLINTRVFNTPADRPDAGKTVVVITDGKPTDPSSVPAAVQAVQGNNIRMLVVGVTNQIDEDTLKLMSSPPKQAGMTYFMATDFRTIGDVKENLQAQACGPTTPTIARDPNACPDQLELAFLIDASGSICDSDPNFVFSTDRTCTNWASIVNATHLIASSFNIGQLTTRIAMILFSSKAKLVWNLNAYPDRDSVLYAIDNLQYIKGGQTDTAGGCDTATNQVFIDSIVRPGVFKAAIIITDGKPTVPSTVPAAVQALQNKNVRTIAVGVTNNVDNNTLVVLASPPKMLGVTYFMTAGYSSISQISQQLLVQTCATSPMSTSPTTSTPTTPTTTPTPTTPSSTTTTTPTTSPTTTTTPSTTTTPTTTTTGPRTTVIVCTAKMDLAFVVDRSGSICDTDPYFDYNRDVTCNNWNLTIQFIHRIVNDLAIGLDMIRVSVVIFSSEVTVQWNLTAYTNKDDLLKAIDGIQYSKGGRTNTTGALNVVRTQVFNTPGDRPDVNNTAIIITDGRPTDPTTVPQAIDAVHNAGIKTLVVGITNAVDELTLKQLSSPPQQLNVTYFMATDFSALDNIRTLLQTKTCGVS